MKRMYSREELIALIQEHAPKFDPSTIESGTMSDIVGLNSDGELVKNEISSGTIVDALGLDSGGKVVKGAAGGKLYLHTVTSFGSNPSVRKLNLLTNSYTSQTISPLTIKIVSTDPTKWLKLSNFRDARAAGKIVNIYIEGYNSNLGYFCGVCMGEALEITMIKSNINAGELTELLLSQVSVPVNPVPQDKSITDTVTEL